jgi:hypothetical protein
MMRDNVRGMPPVADVAARALRGPGFTTLADDAERERARQLKAEAYADAAAADEAAWRNSFADADFLGDAVPLTRDEAARLDDKQRQELKQRAYEDAEEADTNAWRSHGR